MAHKVDVGRGDYGLGYSDRKTLSSKGRDSISRELRERRYRV